MKEMECEREREGEIDRGIYRILISVCVSQCLVCKVPMKSKDVMVILPFWFITSLIIKSVVVREN